MPEDLFARSIANGTTVGKELLAPLHRAGVTPVVVDAGARNGVAWLTAMEYARSCELIAFEPNPDEHRKLVEHQTDAAKAGVSLATFGKETYYDCALWNVDEDRPFHVTIGAGACTLMGVADNPVPHRMWLEGSERSYMEQYAVVRETLPVKCRRLDGLLASGTTLDLLKMDVEGAELAVLQGAEQLLKSQRVLFVKTEWQATAYYRQHPLLGDVLALLNTSGFRLLDFDLNHPRYTRDKSTLPPAVDRRCIYAGDAYFSLDPDRTALPPLTAHRLAIVSLALGFHSWGISLLRDAGLIPADQIEQIETAILRVRRREACAARVEHLLRWIASRAAAVLYRPR